VGPLPQHEKKGRSSALFGVEKGEEGERGGRFSEGGTHILLSMNQGKTFYSFEKKGGPNYVVRKKVSSYPKASFEKEK